MTALSFTGAHGATFSSDDLSLHAVRVTLPHSFKSLNPELLLARFASDLAQMIEHYDTELTQGAKPGSFEGYNVSNYEIVFQG